MSETVLDLTEASDVSLAGGKAVSLGELMRLDFNVPKGFFITTLNTTMTSQLEAEILNHFDNLRASTVAVRSSAVAEDGANDAWAGQFDTFLNVTKNKLIEKIEACWQSAQSARAKAYATQKNLESGKVAVVVQAMVQANISGVAFSVHPVTQNRGQMVIEAVKGLADKLVSGTVTPDTYVVERQTRKVLQKHLVEDIQIIDGNQLKKLADTLIKIEESYGYPVDIEWSFAGKELFILQARPITTLG